ncbi:hypothetical protein RHGRI_008516 [Rhododendron griersonianum]|uniref:Uncharacterized protein n=1 Tax=Rhododendron griersonianum TaxID=479676 RepID=A0AAV6L0T7_9ERIC|nr:hypothetical protein RHGRI_008516 [Rhododendron griersonianum]
MYVLCFHANMYTIAPSKEVLRESGACFYAKRVFFAYVCFLIIGFDLELRF